MVIVPMGGYDQLNGGLWGYIDSLQIFECRVYRSTLVRSTLINAGIDDHPLVRAEMAHETLAIARPKQRHLENVVAWTG